MTVRKNIYDLDANEWSRFVDALQGVKTSGEYDRLVMLHMAAMGVATPFASEPLNPAVRNAAHRGPSFLPWHREYLRILEVALDRQARGVALPYWDWAADAALADPTQARIWTAALVGGSGDPSDNFEVKDGPFVRATWPIPMEQDGPALRRRLGTFEILDPAGNPVIIPFRLSRTSSPKPGVGARGPLQPDMRISSTPPAKQYSAMRPPRSFQLITLPPSA